MSNISLFFNCNKISVNLKDGQNQTVGPAIICSWPKVNDCERGIYICTNSQWHQVDSCAKKSLNAKKLAILIESPHKNEFDAIFNPLLPLNGSGCKRFSAKILNKLASWFNGKNVSCVEVLLINPVQYQASLYHFLNDKISYNLSGYNGNYSKIGHDMRNQVWEFLFETCDLKEDFLNRIRKYAPDYIVNCCTGDIRNSYKKFTNKPKKPRKPSVNNLKSYICTSLYQLGIYYMEDKHPSSW